MLWYYIIFFGQYFVVFFLTFIILERTFGIDRGIKTKPIFHIVGCTILSGAVYSVVSAYFNADLSDMVAWYSIYSVVVSIIYIFIYIKANVISAIVTILNYTMMSVTIHYFVGYAGIALTDPNPPMWVTKMLSGSFPWLFSLLTTSATLILHVAVAFFLIRNPMKFSFQRNGYMIFTLSVPVVYFVILFNLKRQFSLIPSSLAPTLLMVCLLLIIFLYFTYAKLLKEYQEKVSSQLLNRQMELQLQYVNDIQNSNEQINKLNHDMKNHIFYMDWLIDKGDYDGLRNYFNNISSQFVLSENTVDCENQLICAVLTPKVSYAVSNGIDVLVDASVPQNIEIQDSHLCSLILNLIDNAIEASVEIPDAEIKIDIKMIKAYLYITISNKVERDILKNNAGLATTKADKEEHGLGIKIIKDIVAIYGGVIDFKTESGYFIANVMVKNASITN